MSTNESELNSGQKWFWLCLLAFVLLLLVFFKNAWVCDDAYINFRAIEQLFAGNGPNWNPHQRVQVYTSPLWFWLLALFRTVSNDHFFNAIILSFICFLLLSFSLYRNLQAERAAFVFLLLLASNAFADYSTSGLENILGALLLSLAIFSLKSCFEGQEKEKSCYYAIFWLSLLPVCRHDLLTISLPLLAVLLFRHYSENRERLQTCFFAFLPLTIWTLFSLVYYGALFPNTAYAKLSTGISRLELISQGFNYLIVVLQQDPITIFAIAIAIFLGLRSEKTLSRAMAAGMLLNLGYIVWAGGDFMRGRFLTYSFLLAAIILSWNFFFLQLWSCKKSLCIGATAIFVVYLLFFPNTPLNTGFNYSNFNLEHGIADERGYYFDVCSLYAYLYSKPGEVFPDFEWSHIGKQIADKKVAYLENDFNGMLGFWAGTRPIIVDRLALADPFLARLPVTNLSKWRIGHFKREVPQAYRKSIETGVNQFPEGFQKNLYELLHKATVQKELLDFSRFAAILRLNLKLY